MHAELVATGTELLLGEIVDTNAAYIARRLRTIGLNLFYKTTVGDNEDRMTEALRLALSRSDVIITTGGLGPTVDDVTREAVARATGRELVLDPELLTFVERHFARWGRKMSDNNRRQAYKPAGALGIDNPVGTAPIFVVEQDGKYIIVLPGVPREMKYLLDNTVLPYLREKLHLTDVIIARNMRTCALGESNIDSLVGDLERESNPTVGLAAHPGQTDVRITAKGANEAEALRLLDAMEARVRDLLGDVIFGVDDETLEGVVVKLLREKGQTIALVETNTRGRLTQQLTSTNDGLALCKGGLVTTNDETLKRTFDLPVEALKEESPYGAAKTAAVADAVRAKYAVNIGLAVFGTYSAQDGPYGRSSGNTCIGLATDTGTWTRDYAMGGQDEVAQVWVAVRALDVVRRYLLGLPLNPGAVR
jgi:nicotinamide-nucleotide amidase